METGTIDKQLEFSDKDEESINLAVSVQSNESEIKADFFHERGSNLFESLFVEMKLYVQDSSEPVSSQKSSKESLEEYATIYQASLRDINRKKYQSNQSEAAQALEWIKCKHVNTHEPVNL